ncbi:ArgP/LysG family DNA-binding transcriptional regulator [Curtobacterium sp. MCLR17_043]|uniref:LysR family transcriptional regulator ArgP n=1 Tax=Curtobacterium TaxID=2034 RepID=UPI000D85BE8D|nr:MULTISPECIES: LysR family transcriptional regulator ArgP [Curtobacterium]MCS6557712.1 LysR family transcriptional regulator ArgP [Curtobacterium flaccumfaciens]MCS6567845.1 LysR family transcriptional regulator ArgP [Curtobacterium flaccumfaciens pv. flaccumfaciens]MCS6583947.1 LysR family transcriptional regulator ArgP [Curtobacterium flaccumfaciens pv. flaccumfaciens]PYY49245.1 ArgP/LysG family DNA-binding transcriptional regulator [Curtobacterium sp. MCLR17_043]
MTRFQREHLETLLAAVDHGTLDAAARALAITPSAVSQRIKSMEQQVGRVLLQRTTPVRPTADGAVVLRHARQVRLLDEETSRALGGGSSVVPSIPLAVNADSLGTWFLDALALVRADTEVVFDLHREDQDRTAELLRAGTVMGAVTAEADPVQGCSSVPLGIDRYRAVASPAFVARYLGDTGTERRMLRRLDEVPLVDYDRDDDLQQGYLRQVLGHAPGGPRHFVPTSADFARAVTLGFGWGLLPEAQCLEAIDSGVLVELAPGRHADVALWWQRWNLASPLLERVTDAVRATASSRLHPARQRQD